MSEKPPAKRSKRGRPIDLSWHQPFLDAYALKADIEWAAHSVSIKVYSVYRHLSLYPDFKAAFEAIKAKTPPAAVKVKTKRSPAPSLAHSENPLLKLPDMLVTALERCTQAPERIPEAQARIELKIKAAKNDIERGAYEWLKDYVEKHTLRAAEVATRRIAYLNQIETESDIKFEKEKCERDTLHWFDVYAWGIDPRARGILKVSPLAPYDSQREYIEWIERTAFELRTSGVCEKARDQGATEIFVRLSLKHWLFLPHFSALLISKGEDDVDDKKKQSTLFGRLRFQMRYLPLWMLPVGFELDRDMPFMSFSNPENGSELTGRAPVPNVGRGDRTTIVLCDEFAAWPAGGYPQDTALSETSPSIFKVSSVQGKLNRFYEEASAPDCNLFVLDWKEHPFKDQRWYESLPFGYVQKKMRADEIAQEIDRNYEASQPGRVWPHFSEIHTVITMSEFRSFFERNGVRVPGEPDDDDQQVRVPLDWSTARLNDRGATPGHRNAWLWAAGPREHHPLADSIVCYREWLAPLGATLAEIAESVHEFEEEDSEGSGRMVLSLNSHEAQSERDNYEIEHDLYMEAWQTDYEAGIAQMTEFLTVIDKDQPNPFRPQIRGRTRLVILVADGQGEIYKRESGEPAVMKGSDFLGMMNFRRQIYGYHYPPEEAGKPVGKMRPRKIDDDLVDCGRALALAWDGLHAPESKEEKLRARLKRANPSLDFDAIMRIEDEGERRARLNSMDVHYQRLQAAEARPRVGSFFAGRAIERARQDRRDGGTWAQARRRERRRF